MKILAVLLMTFAFGGCAARVPLSDFREDALKERVEFAALVKAYHENQLTCEQFADFASKLAGSESIDSMMENMYR